MTVDAPNPEWHRVHPGAGATRWLLERVRRLHADDPLAPVTVVVPSHHAGLHLRRRLAAAGSANVRLVVLAQVAELLGARRLAAEGKLPLTPVTRDALVRAALRAGGGPLARAAEDGGLVDRLAALAAELRRRDGAPAGGGGFPEGATATSRAALEVVAGYERRRLEAARHDDVDLLDAAAAVLESGAGREALTDLGAILVLLPARLDPPQARLLHALAGRAGLLVALADVEGAADGAAARLGAPAAVPQAVEASTPTAPAALTIASDPIEEVRSAVRDVLAALEGEDPVPLHRTAIVYRDEATYLGPLRDTLLAAGITPALLGGRPLIESVAARGLLGLIRLREQDFARPAVLAWLSGLPDRDGGPPGQARWDQLSRDAGVVRGAGQWRDRLGWLIEDRRRALAQLDAGAAVPVVEARRAALERDIEDARSIAGQVRAIDESTPPPRGATWQDHVAWALRLRDDLLAPGPGWTAEDLEADQMVEEVVRGLTAAGEVEPTVSVAVFLRALEDGLRVRRRPEGRLGSGVVIGPHRLLLGLDFDRVHLLGAVEGGFPAPLPVDPLLPGDPLGRREEHEARERRDWLVALAAAAREVVVSAPLVDLDGRAVYPSPWMLELLAGGGGSPPATAVRGGSFTHPRLRGVGAGSGAAGATPLHVAERREWDAARAHRAGWDLAATALARRADLPLGRAVAVVRARACARFTEFDGNVAAAAGLHLVARGLGGDPQSASGIETWATCPFRHLLGRTLAVAATRESEDERWWGIDPAERGSLIHRILARFFAGVASSGRPAPGIDYDAADLRRMELIADDELSMLRRRGAAGHALMWDNEQAAILADLRALLSRDAAKRAEGSWQPAHLEQAFGFAQDAGSWGPVAVLLPDGRSVQLRGYIDRVDRGPLGVRVLDYKTGRNVDVEVTSANRLNAGRTLQLPVYAAAVRAHDRAEGRPVPNATALYWFCTGRGGFAERFVEIGAAVEEALTQVLSQIDAGIRAGCFPQEPGEHDDFRRTWASCVHCEYDTLCPAGRDALARAKAGDPALEPYRALQPESRETAR